MSKGYTLHDARKKVVLKNYQVDECHVHSRNLTVGRKRENGSIIYRVSSSEITISVNNTQSSCGPQPPS